MTFSLVTSSVTFNTIASGAHNLSLWRGMSATPSNSLITATFPNAATGCAIIVDSISSVSQAGSNGDHAIGVSSISSVDGDNILMLLGLSSAGSTANGWYAVQSSQSSEVPTPNNNYQSQTTAGFLTADTVLISAWTTLSTGTRVTFTASGVDNRAGIIVELVADQAAAAAPSVVTYNRQSRYPDRIPQPPQSIKDPVVSGYLATVARILNAEAYISKFSGTDPNTSNLTGVPGNLAVNVGSASTWTRMWQMSGSIMSIGTTGWKMMRMA